MNIRDIYIYVTVNIYTQVPKLKDVIFFLFTLYTQWPKVCQFFSFRYNVIHSGAQTMSIFFLFSISLKPTFFKEKLKNNPLTNFKKELD